MGCPPAVIWQGAGLSSLKGQAPKSYRQLNVQMTELQDSQLKVTTFMSLFVTPFNADQQMKEFL